MKELNVKCTDCSYEKLLTIAGKCGFVNVSGKKHCKIENIDGQFVTMIPRNACINKFTVKGILKRFVDFGANIKIS